ncbi:MAG: DUF6062 family protein, partial [Actinomycetota bacterium]|nr:DUF6062 family protein [Actinomycetota bacterium]
GVCSPTPPGRIRRARRLPEALLEITREALKDLEADLDLYVRHSDHQHKDEPWGKERDSWKRIVAKMVGPRRP